MSGWVGRTGWCSALVAAAVGAAVFVGLGGGCGGKEGAGAERASAEGVSGDAAARAPAAVTLEAGAEGLVFRYLDPASGRVLTATSVDAIPEQARAQVVVFDEAHPMPAGWDLVADLRGGLPAQATPRQGFQLDPEVAQARVARADNPAGGGVAARRHTPTRGTHQVTIFTEPGCGFCRKARRFFRAQRIPFSEYNLETDPSARSKLRELANRAGLSPAALHGVPIIFVDDQVVVGFDEAAVRRLLGQ